MADNLVPLRAGAGYSLAFVHPASGLITAFRRLVPHLDGTSAVFALENPEPRRPPCSIGELAADYWTQLADTAPGPLVLAGWSFGGAVALDMAGAAEAAGHHVAAVVLIDAAAPHLLRSARSPRPVPLGELAGLFEIGPAELRADAALTSYEEAVDLIVATLRTARGMPHIEAADLWPFVDTYRWHTSVARRPWRPVGCRAPVILIRASDEPGWDDAPADLGWTGVLRKVPVTLWTPGTHHDLMSHEHAPRLARVLSVVLTVLDEPSVSIGGVLR